ncbi:hypothetical protein [Fusobacterium gastrosuis]|nr:hypothetical protein [Fusobacterium gastrosuis]
MRGNLVTKSPEVGKWELSNKNHTFFKMSRLFKKTGPQKRFLKDIIYI